MVNGPICPFSAHEVESVRQFLDVLLFYCDGLEQLTISCTSSKNEGLKFACVPSGVLAKRLHRASNSHFGWSYGPHDAVAFNISLDPPSKEDFIPGIPPSRGRQEVVFSK